MEFKLEVDDDELGLYADRDITPVFMAEVVDERRRLLTDEVPFDVGDDIDEERVREVGSLEAKIRWILSRKSTTSSVFMDFGFIDRWGSTSSSDVVVIDTICVRRRAAIFSGR